MTTVIAALIGLAAILAGALLSAASARKTESRKQTAQLAADAVIDLLRAFSAAGESQLALADRSPDPLLRDLESAERIHFVNVLAESRVTMISAKARLVTFGSYPIAKGAIEALTGDFDGASPASQRALCELVQRIRHDLFPQQERVPDAEVIGLLFGADAAALS